MKISKLNYLLLLTNFAYLSSIIYVPLLLMNNAVTNKFLPFISLCLLFVALKDEIKPSYLMQFPLTFPFALSCIFSVGGYISLAFTLVFLSLIAFIFPYYIMLKLYGEKFIIKHIKFIISVSIFSAVIGWVEFFQPSIVNQVFFLRGSIYMDKGEVSSLFSNPNVFGMMMAFSFQISLIIYKSNIKILLLFAVFLSAIYLTGSRMAMFIITIMFILYYIPINRISRNLTILFVTGFSFYISINFELAIEYIDLNMRDLAWQGALNAFSLNPFFGIGLGQFQEDISRYALGIYDQSANNLFIGLLSELGIVGTSLFTLFLLSALISFNKPNRQYFSTQSHLMIIFLITSQFSENMIIYVGPYVLLIVLFTAIGQWSKR